MKYAFLVFFCALVCGCTLWQTSTYDTAPGASEEKEEETIDWVEHLRQLTLLREWQIKGKIGVRTANDGGSAYLDWSQSFDSFHLLLSGPLGQGSTIISGNPLGARLQNSDGIFLSDSPEQLVADHTGWEIPINHLLYWVKGIPAPDDEPTMTHNEKGLLSKLTQDGWTLSYDRYVDAMGQTLPRRIKLTKEDLKVTLVIKQWLPLRNGEGQ